MNCRTGLFVFFILLPFYVLPQTQRGLVAAYTFNHGDSRDEAGQSPAKVSDVVLTEDRFGNPRSAYFLLGNTSSYINLGSSPALKPKSASISLWVLIEKPNYRGKGYYHNPILLTKNLQANDFYEGYSMGYDWDNGKLSVGTSIDSTKQISIYSAKGLPLMEWHHIVMAYNNDFIWLYIDGKLQSDGQPVRKNFESVFSPTDSVMIGNSANSKNERFLIGKIDDIFIYNRVLSPQEVLDLYNAPDYNRFNIYLKWAIRGCIALIIISLITWLFIRRSKQELEKQKEKNRINALLNELETKSIRTQMNPHFIFNSLNTLQRFILERDFQNSNLYLTRFSTLLRRLMESSVAESITLEEETEILKNYIQIESMRFDDAFEYTITCHVPEPRLVHIPFMLVQPFVENAIWHGLLPKKGFRLVSVQFSELDSQRIFCQVDDNGIGRQAAGEKKSPLKARSLAMDFIKQRLELIERSTGIHCGFTVIDKKNEQDESIGTRIEIIIPKLEL